MTTENKPADPSPRLDPPSSPGKRLNFPKKLHLRSKRDYDAVFDARTRESRGPLSVGAKPNELLMKDPSLLSESARAYAHYPGGHPEAYPDGLKNFLLRVYSYIAGASKEVDFSTFQDGHDELAICEAVLPRRPPSSRSSGSFTRPPWSSGQ